MKNILFICSYNACRSQMAEGIAKSLANGDFEVRSAGINAGGVNGDAITSMKEIDIDISDQTSDVLTSAHYDWADYVVTVCDSAEQRCPVVPPGKVAVHWSVPDPYGNYSDEEQKSHSFVTVREMLQRQIEKLYDGIRAEQF